VSRSRIGNWLTAEQSQKLWQAPDGERLKEKRDRALLAILLACGVRRHEAVALNLGHIQRREEHWAIVDLKGKAGHIRTIPMPIWAAASAWASTFCRQFCGFLESGFSKMDLAFCSASSAAA